MLDKSQSAPTSKLDFVKVTEQTFFSPDQWAVIGLSPRSDFLSYLRANNQDVFVKLSTSITKAEGESTELKTDITLNPTNDKLEQLYYNNFSTTVWKMNGTYSIGADSDNPEAEYCLYPHDSNIFSAKDGVRTHIRKMIFKQLCNQE